MTHRVPGSNEASGNGITSRALRNPGEPGHLATDRDDRAAAELVGSVEHRDLRSRPGAWSSHPADRPQGRQTGHRSLRTPHRPSGPAVRRCTNDRADLSGSRRRPDGPSRRGPGRETHRPPGGDLETDQPPQPAPQFHHRRPRRRRGVAGRPGRSQPTRGPRCATTGPATPSTVTPPTSSPPSSPRPPDRPGRARRLGSVAPSTGNRPRPRRREASAGVMTRQPRQRDRPGDLARVRAPHPQSHIPRRGLHDRRHRRARPRSTARSDSRSWPPTPIAAVSNRTCSTRSPTGTTTSGATPSTRPSLSSEPLPPTLANQSPNSHRCEDPPWRRPGVQARTQGASRPPRLGPARARRKSQVGRSPGSR